MKAGIISLGVRSDAYTFEKGCKGMGFDIPLPIRKPKPTQTELNDFFVRKVDWLFLAGHSGGNNIVNEDSSVNISFEPNQVNCIVDKVSTVLKKNTASLTLDTSVKLVLFGGCSMLNNRDDILAFRQLFNNSIFIGFKQLTGWKMVNAMLGDGFIKDHFFKRAEGHIDNPDELAKIWLETAASKYAYANTENESRFASVDISGKRWIIDKGKIINDITL